MRHFLFILLLFIPVILFADEVTTSRYFETIKNNPQKLETFLYAMPKGGDLHNHLGGASMAENMIEYGKNDKLCVDAKSYSVNTNNCAAENKLATAPHYPNLYNSIIDAWSMRNFTPGKETGHDHFFATFDKYYLVSSNHSGEMLTEVVERAGKQNISYLELMVTPDNNASGMLGKEIGWNANLIQLRKDLLARGLNKIVNQISQALNADETLLNKTLQCQTAKATPGCHVKVKYLYQILREQPPAQVFAQLLAGFEVASKDPRIVGINMVQPEDGKISMRDYGLHMKMVAFLHQLYPQVNISLHAGELVPGLVPTTGLRSHIRDAVQIAHAQRIGHGVDIAYENNYQQLLKDMSKKQVMVEINLTSNAAILEVSGKDHPILLYMQYNVPIALSTDDEGVLRTNLTEQYKAAILTYHFTYPEIKRLIRNSLTYSFLPKQSLWNDSEYKVMNINCKNDILGAENISARCKLFLDHNEKAKYQWELEKKFQAFEK